MKLGSYYLEGKLGWGAVLDDGIAPLKHRWPSLMNALQDGIAAVTDEAARTTERVLLSSVRWMLPIPDPKKIFCVGLNYRQHAAETGHAKASFPVIFPRHADSFVAHQQPMVRQALSVEFDYEAELAVVIGSTCRHVSSDDALGYVAGYTCLSETSVRDYQKHSVAAGKNFESSGSIGPWIVTSDEIADPQGVMLTGRLNGQVMQQSRGNEMVFSVAEVIAYISSFTTLRAGDIIAMGTPEGVGMTRTPPIWLKAGDVFEVEVEGLGVLLNPVVDETASEGSSHAR